MIKLIIGNDAGAIVIMVCILITVYFCAVAGNQAASRVVWAFARDKAIPGWKFWSRAGSDGNILPAIGLTYVVQAAVVLIDLGSTLAYNTFIGVAVVSYTTSYFIPILASLLQGRKSVSFATFGAGYRWVCRLSNHVTIVWTLFVTVLFCFVSPVVPFPLLEGADSASSQ